MEKSSLVYVIIFLVSVFIASLSQVALKKSAEKKYESRIKEYINPLVVGAYFFFVLSSLCTMFAYRGVPMSLGPVLEASGYIYISILGLLFLKEKITMKKVIGNVIIVIGIAVFYI